MALTAMAPPPRLRAPTLVDGVELRAAELVTRRLLLHPNVIPVYRVVPMVPRGASRVRRFLEEDGFASLHDAVDPGFRGVEAGRGYGVPGARAGRKRAQVASMVACVAAVVAGRESGVLVDMCGGCGHVGLVCAALWPGWVVRVMDSASVALAVVKRRALVAGLDNVEIVLGDVGAVTAGFDVAVALHACGGASDVVLAEAVRCGAAVVLSSCCVGGIVAGKGSVTGKACATPLVDPVGGGWVDWSVPRSALFRPLLEGEEYTHIARAADFGEKIEDIDAWRRVAKSLLEADRAAWIADAGYATRLVKMRPLDCTPKNDVLVAWPAAHGDKPWEEDADANTYVADMADGSVIRGFSPEKVATVERKLRYRVCNDKSDGYFLFPAGIGPRGRKVVHAVAESLGLWHVSQGRGKHRRVLVRRSQWWPLFFQRYVGLGGPDIERACDALLHKVPELCIARRRELRGCPLHMTVIGPHEISSLAHELKTNREALLEFVHRRLYGSQFHVRGLGRCQESAKCMRERIERPTLCRQCRDSIDARLCDCTARGRGDGKGAVPGEAYFAVVDWPEAAELRRELGLEWHEFHITLGFADKDVHHAPKGQSSVFYHSISSFSPWR